MNLVNARTGLGIVGEDPTLDDVPYLTADPDLADIQAMWSGSALAERIVCTPVGDILSAGFDFSPVGEQADGELPDKVKAYLEARGWPLVRWEAMTKARIFGGAAAVVTFGEGEDLQEPVRPDAIQTIQGFVVADRYELRPLQWSIQIGPYYNRPILYSLHPWVPGAPAPSEDDFRTHGQLIHASRVIPFVGKYVPERLSDGYARGWSDSVLRAVRQKLIDLYRVHRGVARLVVNIAERIIKDPSLFAKLDTMTDAEFVALLRRNKMASSFNGDRVIPPDASVEWTAPPTTGVRDLVLETMVALAGATSPGMPVEKLFGIAPPGGLDGAGEYVRDNYWSNLDQARTYHVIPNERRAIDFALMAKDGPTGGRPVVYTLTGGAFKIETDQERAQRLQTESGAASTYVQMGALHPMEVRASLKKAEQTLWQLEDRYDDELAQGGQGGIQMPGGDMQGQMAAMGGGEEPPPGGATPPDGGPGPRNDSDDWTDDDDAVAGEMEEWKASPHPEEDRFDSSDRVAAFNPPIPLPHPMGTRLTPGLVRRLDAYLSHFSRFEGTEGRGAVHFGLWGGQVVADWASKIVDELDAPRLRMDAEFNEDLHPRDHGKFAKKGEGESAGGQKVELKKPLGEHSVEELQGLYQQLYGKPGNITNVANLKTWVKKGLEAEGGHAGKVAMLKEHYKAITGKETGIPHEPQLKYAVNQALKKAGKEPITDWSGFYESKAGAGPEKASKPADAEAEYPAGSKKVKATFPDGSVHEYVKTPEGKYHIPGQAGQVPEALFTAHMNTMGAKISEEPLESPVTIPMPALKEKVGEIAADPGLKPAEKTEAIDAVIAQHHAAVDAQEGTQGAAGPSSGKALADMTPDELNAHLKGLDLPGLQAAYQEVHGVPTTTTTAANLKTWIKQGLSAEHKAQVAHLQGKLEQATGKKTSIAKVPQLKHALNNALKAKGEAPITDWSELETVAKGAANPSPEAPVEAPTILPAAGERSNPEPSQEAPVSAPSADAPAAMPGAPATVTRKASPDEIPYQVAHAAHAGSSMDPERRAVQRQNEFASVINNDYDDLMKMARNDEEKAAIDQAFDQYKEGYKQRYIDALSADSRTLSSMVTGPSNFPTARNQKALNVAHKRWQEVSDFRDAAIARMKRASRPEDAPISSTDSEAHQKLSKKLDALEKTQQVMRDTNKIVRGKGTDEEKVAKIIALGMSEKHANEILKPDFMGRIGFADYALSNNSAEIRRIKGRMDELTKRQKTAEETGGSRSVDFDGGKVELNYGDGYLRISHDDKPTQETIDKMKSRGFNWTPSEGAWRRKLNNSAIYAAHEITGIPTSEIEKGTPASEQPDRPAPVQEVPAPVAPVTKAPHADESLRFGKHSGRNLEQIWRAEPGYLTWAAANLNNNALRSKIAAFVAHKKGNA